MSRRRLQRQANKKASFNIKAYIYGFVGVGICLLSVFAIIGGDGQDLDADGCFRNQPIAAHSLFLLDRTDPYPEKTRPLLMAELIKEAEKLAPNERFSLYAIQDERNDIPVKLFSKCSPGNKNTVSTISDTPLLTEKKFRTEFLADLQKTVQSIKMNHETSQSRIMEGLSFVKNIHQFDESVSRKRLIIFSDLLENSNVANQITTGIIPYAELKDINFVPQAKLSDVDVKLIYVSNPDWRHIQSSAHYQFWQDYFGKAGVNSAKSLEIYSLKLE
jgi:hypothetical protein